MLPEQVQDCSCFIRLFIIAISDFLVTSVIQAFNLSISCVIVNLFDSFTSDQTVGPFNVSIGARRSSNKLSRLVSILSDASSSRLANRSLCLDTFLSRPTGRFFSSLSSGIPLFSRPNALGRRSKLLVKYSPCVS